MRTFNPILLGRYETDAWVSYYQRRWPAFLRAALGLVREGFGLPWADTVWGAWLVLRANQVWAPYPDNDPEQARAFMRDFYRLVARAHREHFDPDEAARLEVEWWRVHRYLQRDSPDGSIEPLTQALTDLYTFVYAVPAEAARPAAAHRAEAMRISDAWVAAGGPWPSVAVAAERRELIRGYALLRAAVATG